MPHEPQPARVIERYVLAKFDGDPPTPESPKDPVEVVTIERHADGSLTHAVDKKE